MKNYAHLSARVLNTPLLVEPGYARVFFSALAGRLGIHQLADAAGKPLWALCYDMNCSAGMALASSAHHRLITQTGIAGSIGVVMAHSDYSKMLDESGINVILIHSGSHKVEGNPYEALPKEVLQRFQSSTDQLREEFGQLVSGFTGLSLEAVLATEAATYRGQEAIDVGLADELINGHEAIAYFSDYLSRSGSVSTGATMSTKDATKTTLEQQAPQAGADAGQTLPETTPAAGTQQTASQPVQHAPTDPAAAAPQSGAAMTAAEMQARIGGILNLDEAKAHQDTANHLAFNTQLTVEEAQGVLATLPEPSTTGKMDTALDRAMGSEEQPNLLADQQAGGEQPLDQSKDKKMNTTPEDIKSQKMVDASDSLNRS